MENNYRPRGLLRAIAHEKPALTQWTKEMLQYPDIVVSEDVAAPHKNFFKSRLEISKDVFEQLVSHAHVHSPHLARLISKAWDVNEEMAVSMIRQIETSQEEARDLQMEAQRLLRFTEKQMSKYTREAEGARERAAFAERENMRLGADIEVLEGKLAAEKLEIRKLRELVDDLRAGGDDDVDLRKGSGNDEQLEDALSRMGRESAMQQQYGRDMDRLVSKLNPAMFALQNRGASAKIAASSGSDAACQTERHADDDEEGGTFKVHLAPPRPPKKKKLGWHLPYGFRALMANFKVCKRVLPLKSLRRMILVFYLQKLVSDDKYDRDGLPRLTMQEHTYEELFNKYGLKNLTDWHVSELINSLRFFHKSKSHSCKRLELFGNFLGAFEKKTATRTRYLKWGDIFFMKAVAELKRLGILTNAVEHKEETRLGISRGKAVSMAKDLFGHIGSTGLGHILELVNQLPSYEAISPTSHFLHPKAKKLSSGGGGGASTSLAAIDDGDFVLPTQSTPIGKRAMEKLDLDDVLYLFLEEWLSNNTRWSKRLNTVFFRHCVSFRANLGAVVKVNTADHYDPKMEDQEDDGYFHTLEYPAFRCCAIELDPDAPDDSIEVWFNEARKLLANNANREFKLGWREVVDKASGDTFFYNDTTEECAWEIPRDDRVNSDVEIDRPTFVEYAKFRGWWREVEQGPRGAGNKPRGLTRMKIV